MHKDESKGGKNYKERGAEVRKGSGRKARGKRGKEIRLGIHLFLLASM
jgi:hypothetical protein